MNKEDIPNSPVSPVHPDLLIDEIRAIKERVSAAAGHDVRALVAQLEREQAIQRRPLIDRRHATSSTKNRA